MASWWEEELWLVASTLNSVLGLHLILRYFLSSSWPPLLPIFGAVAADLCLAHVAFSTSRRHKNYFTTKRKILQSICLGIIIASLSESLFSSKGYRWVALFACLAYSIPALWATFRRPCRIPQILPAAALSYNTYFLFWLFWLQNDGGLVQVGVGASLFGQSSDFFVYHVYMEADRIMHDAEYYEWLVQEIRRGAVGRSEMLADLFMARGAYLPLPE